MRLYDEDNEEISVRIENILSTTQIQVKSEDEIELPTEIFIYGQEVDNFLFLDKNHIFTVATAALQEVDRQLQAEKEKTTMLETKVSTLEAQLNNVLTRLSVLENSN